MSGLFGSNVIEVALGLFFTYFLLSLLCSNINEIIAGVMRWRAKNLEEGIKRLLYWKAPRYLPTRAEVAIISMNTFGGFP